MDLTEKFKIDYESTRQYFFHLADTRFKLLGLLPIVTGFAVAAFPSDLTPEKGFAFALLGLLVTLGLTIYDQRNTQIYDRLVKRAQWIEDQIGFEPSPITGKQFGGAFRDRPRKRSVGFIPIIWHDLGLALVYAASIGAWAYLATNELWRLWGKNEIVKAGFLGGLTGFILSFVFLLFLAWMNDREKLLYQPKEQNEN